ncbi:MAG TPA: c-type cytochrome [Bacteroidia bacterium]|nr:c-type cytochrome [Bacteroidia bacterium]
MNLRRIVKKLTTALTVLTATVLFSLSANAQADKAAGEKLFNENCTSCHALDDKVVGPALRGLHTRPGRSETWLIKWIKNSQTMVSAGDPLAVQLYEANNKQVMNAFEFLSDADIKNILTYIKEAPTEVAGTTTGGTTTGGETATTGATTGVDAEATAGTKKLINVLLVLIVISILVIIGSVFDVLGLISRYTGVEFSNPHKVNAWLMIIFLVVGMSAAIWEFMEHGKYVLIDNAASEHGASIDSMLKTTLWMTGAVFVVTQIVLFVFAFIYRFNPNRKAYFYPHNNMLEYIWTIIPAIALTVLVINGFKKWTQITSKAPENAETVEVFAYQFGWNVRYSGADRQLGEVSFNLISGTNPLGLGVEAQFAKLLTDVDTAIVLDSEMLRKLKSIPDPTDSEKDEIARLTEKVRLQRAHLSRLNAFKGNTSVFNGAAEDDLVLKEIVLVKGKPVNFAFRARDVIHSAHAPHFRMQMNVVPGMPTNFWLTPTKTTQEMRNILGDPKFDYHLYCAKICGAAHYNMKIKIVVVETEGEYREWLAKQKPAFKTVAGEENVKGNEEGTNPNSSDSASQVDSTAGKLTTLLEK